MRPPYCYVCGLSLRDIDEGQDLWSVFSLVTFELDPQEEAARQARDRAGWTGHPEGTEWFCDQHVALAKARIGMHWRDALASIGSTGQDGAPA